MRRIIFAAKADSDQQPCPSHLDTTPDKKTTNLAPTTTLETDGEHAPTINIHVSSLNGCANLNILPDSGADISVAGPSTLTQLHEHPDNLLPSGLTHWAVNGTSMHPLGKLPVTLELEGVKYTEDSHMNFLMF